MLNQGQVLGLTTLSRYMGSFASAPRTVLLNETSEATFRRPRTDVG